MQSIEQLLIIFDFCKSLVGDLMEYLAFYLYIKMHIIYRHNLQMQPLCISQEVYIANCSFGAKA